MRLATQQRQHWPAAPFHTELIPSNSGLVNLNIQQLSSELFDFVSEAADPMPLPLFGIEPPRLQRLVESEIALRR
ncbi:MAG: hypothetical protein ACI92S_004150 [Planctomycetaceae bacterium]|jgi:hypothetical protein